HPAPVLPVLARGRPDGRVEGLEEHLIRDGVRLEAPQRACRVDRLEEAGLVLGHVRASAGEYTCPLGVVAGVECARTLTRLPDATCPIPWAYLTGARQVMVLSPAFQLSRVG